MRGGEQVDRGADGKIERISDDRDVVARGNLLARPSRSAAVRSHQDEVAASSASAAAMARPIPLEAPVMRAVRPRVQVHSSNPEMLRQLQALRLVVRADALAVERRPAAPASARRPAGRRSGRARG